MEAFERLAALVGLQLPGASRVGGATIDAGIERLVSLGVPLQHIHYDKFTDGAGAASTSEADQRVLA